MNGSEKMISYRPVKFSDEEMLKRSVDYFEFMNSRRTVRHFSKEPVNVGIMENIIKTASTSPSGAHKQPWSFCLVSNQELKSKIRKSAEKEEFENYHGRMSERWLEDLEKLETNEIKPFLDDAPWLIVIFKKAYDVDDSGKHNNYYVNESVGLASGILISAIHNAGLVCLTHTPSPMNFLTELLKRPTNERPYLLIPVGFAAEKVEVPNLIRKGLEEVLTTYV